MESFLTDHEDPWRQLPVKLLLSHQNIMEWLPWYQENTREIHHCNIGQAVVPGPWKMLTYSEKGQFAAEDSL